MIAVTQYFVDLRGEAHYLFAPLTVEVTVQGHIQNSTPAADNVLRVVEISALKHSSMAVGDVRVPCICGYI